jgi:hypothetical protein
MGIDFGQDWEDCVDGVGAEGATACGVGAAGATIVAFGKTQDQEKSNSFAARQNTAPDSHPESGAGHPGAETVSEPNKDAGWQVCPRTFTPVEGHAQ